MKKQYFILGIIIAFLLSFRFSFAQKIHLSDTSNHWTTLFYYSQGASINMPVYKYYNFTDANLQINGHVYNQLHSANAGNDLNCLIRDEGDKVYLKPTNSSMSFYRFTDTANEFVYFDYSLHVGDTLTMPMVEIFSPQTQSKHVVKTIDSILINNIWHKVFSMEIVQGINGSYVFTEGLGTVQGPMIVRYAVEYQAQLVCFKNNGVIPLAIYNQCDTNSTTSINPVSDARAFQVYPNPAIDVVTLNYLGSEKAPFTVTITDMLGNINQTKSFQTSQKLYLNGLNAGIYIIQVKKENEVVWRDKIVVRR